MTYLPGKEKAPELKRAKEDRKETADLSTALSAHCETTLNEGHGFSRATSPSFGRLLSARKKRCRIDRLC